MLNRVFSGFPLSLTPPEKSARAATSQMTRDLKRRERGIYRDPCCWLGSARREGQEQEQEVHQHLQHRREVQQQHQEDAEGKVVFHQGAQRDVAELRQPAGALQP